MADRELELPEMDPERELEYREAFATAYQRALKGEMDTDSFNDLAEGVYEGTIVDCQCIASKDREGKPRMPRVLWRIKTPTWTSTYSLPSEFHDRALGVFVKLGADLDAVPVDPVKAGPREIAEVYTVLGKQVIGVEVVARINARKTEQGVFNNLTMSRRG